MSLMRAFTYDAESVELTSEECDSFATLVKSACYPDLQHRISVELAMVGRPQPTAVGNYIERQVVQMWRAESRV